MRVSAGRAVRAAAACGQHGPLPGRAGTNSVPQRAAGRASWRRLRARCQPGSAARPGPARPGAVWRDVDTWLGSAALRLIPAARRRRRRRRRPSVDATIGLAPPPALTRAVHVPCRPPPPPRQAVRRAVLCAVYCDMCTERRPTAQRRKQDAFYVAIGNLIGLAERWRDGVPRACRASDGRTVISASVLCLSLAT